MTHRGKNGAGKDNAGKANGGGASGGRKCGDKAKLGGGRANRQAPRSPSVGVGGANGFAARSTFVGGRASGQANENPSDGVSPRLGGGLSVVGGTSGLRGASSGSITSSQNNGSASVSRTRLPSQYPPSTQPTAQFPSSPQPAQQVHVLIQNNHPQPPPPPVQFDEQFDEPQFEQAPIEDHNQAFEEEDEADPPNLEELDYELLLDDLLHMPGREQLVILSEHPIPNKRTTW